MQLEKCKGGRGRKKEKSHSQYSTNSSTDDDGGSDSGDDGNDVIVLNRLVSNLVRNSIRTCVPGPWGHESKAIPTALGFHLFCSSHFILTSLLIDKMSRNHRQVPVPVP